MQGTWLRKPEAGRVIVFVHGFLSSNDTCWNSADTSWPELVVSDPSLNGCGVYKFDYRTSLSSRLFGPGDAAKSLTFHLEVDGVLDQDQIVFVCHSQGGIVVRRHLVRAQREYERRQVGVGLLLVASPSLGSGYAGVVSWVWYHAQLSALRLSQKNHWLNELDSDFIDMKEERRFPLFGKELIEEHPMVLPRGLLPRAQIVPPHSAARYFARSRVIPGTDHSSIAKPASVDSEQHRELVHLLQANAPSTGERFAATSAALAAELRATAGGFALAQRAAQRQLERIFVDAAAARTIAGPSPAFLAAAPPVPRASLRATGEVWWAGSQQVLVQLGQEGVGKTWGALDLVRLLGAAPDGPLPVVISAGRASDDRDALEAVVSVLVDIGEFAGMRASDAREFWHERLLVWAGQPGARLVVLIDGLDELDPFDWATWLAPLLTQRWQGLVRIVLTCRDDDWAHRIRLDEALPADTERGAVTRFLPEERDAYLASRGVVPGKVSDQVLGAALHPRTAFHLTRLAAELGDLTRITREQLLLRDFHNRHLLKGGALDADGFRALVIAQATAAQAAALEQRAFQVTPGALIDSAADISGYDRGRMRTVLSDLTSGAWFERSGAGAHLLSFRDESLPDAVGLALADLIRPLPADAALQEIDRFLEPWGADDLVERVLRTCATALIVDGSVGHPLCAAVLQRWEEKPSYGGGGQDFWRRLHVFRPELFLDHCANHARGSNNWLQAWGIASLWEDHPAERLSVEARVGAWLSTIPLPEDHDSGNPQHDRHVNRDRHRQCERLAVLERSEPGRWAPRIGRPAANWPQAAVRTAAQIVGFLPRLPFVPAIAAWAENHAAAGHVAHQREIGALLRHNDSDHRATLDAIRAQARRLSTLDGDGAVAAAHLLRATGEPGDAAQAELLDPRPETTHSRWVGRIDGTDVVGPVGGQPLPRHRMLLDVLSDFAADPSVDLDPALAAGLSTAVRALAPADLPSLFDHGGAAVAVVLRWHPDALFPLYGRYLEEEPATDDATSDHAFQAGAARRIFHRHALGAIPFLSEEECASVADVIEAHAVTDGDGLGAALALRLAHRPLDRQIALLRDTPSSVWPQDYKYLLSQPLGSEVADLITDLDLGLRAEALAPLVTLAWRLLLRFGTDVTRDWRDGLHHADEDVRRQLTRLATYADGAKAAAQLLTSSGSAWTVGGDTLDFETSSLLLEATDEALLPLLGRLDPEAIVQSYLTRPQLRVDVTPHLYTWIKDKLLVARTSRSFGGNRGYFLDRQSGFAAFCAAEHDEVVAILRTAWDDEALRDNIRFDHHEGPAWALIEAVAPREPELVKTIWRGCVADLGGMWVGSTEAFPCDLPPGAAFDDLRAEMLGRANTDEKLFTAVRGLEKHGHGEFLLEWIRKGLSGDRAIVQACALTVAGFLDATDGALALWRDIGVAPAPAGWVGEVRAAAETWFGRVRTARHWYLLMSRAADEKEAYRAFWLFSRSSDERYPLFYKLEPNRVSPTSWRAQWLDLFGNAMKAVRAEAAKDLKNLYLSDRRVDQIIHGL